MINRKSLRYAWSHEMYIHRMAVRTFNRMARHIPFTMKYKWGIKLRSNNLPYTLIRDGSVVVQIGAPQDTLSTGRSRAMYFSLFAGETGKVLVVEPDGDSVKAWQAHIAKHGFNNIVLHHSAVWSEEETLRIYVNDAHPAANFTEGSKDHYTQAQLQEYRVVELPANSLDNILAQHNIDHVDLVSITTNGAEREIIGGMSKVIAGGLPYICLARTGENYVEMMAEVGYELFEVDDRGYTFRRLDA